MPFPTGERPQRSPIVHRTSPAAAIYFSYAEPIDALLGIGAALDPVMGSENTKVVAGLLRIFAWLVRRPQVLPGHQEARNNTAGSWRPPPTAGEDCRHVHPIRFAGLFGTGVVHCRILMYVVPHTALMAAGVLGLVEGSIYLTKSDEDFLSIYVTNKKQKALVRLERWDGVSDVCWGF